MRSPIRVVVLCHAARLSGAELGLARLLPALDGVSAHVVLAEDGPLVERLAEAGASVEVLGLHASTRALPRERVRPAVGAAAAAADTVAHAVRLARRLRTLRPDVVHANSLKALVYGSLAARLTSTPLLWHAHDRISTDYLPRAAVLLVRACAGHAETIVANSHATMATLGGARTRALVIPYSVSGDAPPEPPARDTPVRVGMVGRISPWKGQHVFLEAFARAFPGGRERAAVVGAALFGESGYESELRLLCDRLGLDGRVEFRGFQDDVGAELSRLDVLVHASTIPEPFGQVVVEGMHAGLPVVAADAGGPAEIVTDGQTGFLYPPGDAGALAARLRLLAGDPRLRRRVGVAAQASTGRYAPGLVAEQMGAAYRLTVARAGRRPR
jgi:glycosyltransferase involved in cell wall biosynthesis